MIGARFEIRGRLKVLSPLHIGSGQRTQLDGVEAVTADNMDKEDARAFKSAVVRDTDGNPYIPGSCLKGLVRRCLGENAALLGRSSEELSESGRAVFWDAFLETGDDPIEVISRTSIDADSGTAAAGRLFNEEVVRPGTEFGLDVFLADGTDDGVKAALIFALSRLMAEDGLALGADTRQGNGRICLAKESLSIVARSAEGAEHPVDWSDEIEQIAPADGGPRYVLRLSSDDPFLIVDAANSYKREKKDDAHIVALKDYGSNGPRLTGSTLLGALRSAFEWQSSPNETMETSDWLSARAASATERLFGTSKWRGRVEIDHIKAVGGEPKPNSIPSVKIDRFSGGPMDNALFFTEGWTGCGFEVSMRLRNIPDDAPQLNSSDREAFLADQQVFQKFLSSLTDPVWGGLELGHGGNKGYGWFDVELTDLAAKAGAVQ